MAIILPLIGDRVKFLNSPYHHQEQEGVIIEYETNIDKILIKSTYLQSNYLVALESIKHILDFPHNIKLGRYLFTKFGTNLVDILEITGHLIKWKYVKETVTRFNTSDIFINNLKLIEELPDLNKDSSWTGPIKLAPVLTLMFDDFGEVP